VPILTITKFTIREQKIRCVVPLETVANVTGKLVKRSLFVRISLNGVMLKI